MLTRQEIFDKVATHLMAQNAVSQDEAGSCLYRGPNGLKCAAGIIITDEAYHPGLENISVHGGQEPARTLMREALDKSGVDPADHQLLQRLQSIHDCDEPKWWKFRLTAACHDYGLTLPPCLQEPHHA